MKIEIAENMLYSWLRHCKECQIVQANYKASKIWQKKDESSLKKIFDAFQVDSSLKNFHFKSKNNKEKFETVLQQTECDLLGINYDEKENMQKIYAVESAFHERGLGYKNSERKVLQKIFRDFLIIRLYFPIDSVNVIFATPAVSKEKKVLIDDCIKLLESFFSKQNCKVSLKFIANEEYVSEIVDPLCEYIDEIADGNELFVRAIKLNNLASKYKKQNNVTARNSGSKIGFIVNTRLRKLLLSEEMRENDVANLKSNEYCKSQFGLNFPVLRLCTRGRNDSAGYLRYYAEPIKINGKKYYVTNDWYERNKKGLLGYLEDKGF